jgi:hypothetical protein
LHHAEISPGCLGGRVSLIATARAQQGSGTTKGEPVLINNVRVFDGIEDE